ncbi:MAG: 2-amino-4-hydroxy-6-hydroxymethyldihydropteridine diphosphokinase [Thermovirgaceae bacterium]|nr:2-amino-4-hydroxy-6-hydroxymethyldihydropteridine diphosphokinase [Thermovirgaceae bacterium]
MQAGISLGSNLGDRLGNIRQAALLLKERAVSITVSSDVFETEPWGHKDQPSFLNACLLTDTEESPHDLLLKIQSIENELGRIPRFRWGPREIDIDILFMDGLTINDKDLVLPHPEMHRRAFVLVPLSQVAPQWVHPLLGQNIGELAAQVPKIAIVRITNL